MPSAGRTRRTGISQLRCQMVPGVWCRVPGDSGHHWYSKLRRQIVSGAPLQFAADHVLDDAEQIGSVVYGCAHGAPDGVAGLGSRDGHGEHGGRLAEEIAPGDVAQKLPERGGFHSPPPDEALGTRPFEGEWGAVFE